LPQGLQVISAQERRTGLLNSGDPSAYAALVRDPVTLCAEAYAAWHTSWLNALELRSTRREGVWRALDRPPRIYLAGITLEANVPPQALADVPGSVGDVWHALDLTPHGFRVWRTEPWFYRPAGPLPEPAETDLELVRVTTPQEVEEFEAVSVRGFGEEDDTIEPGTLHPSSGLADAAMHMYVGRAGGRAVAAATGYVLDDVVGVFGVTTVASARRRGYGTALTRAAILADTGLPSVLAPSEEAVPLYRRLGFEAVGALRIWSSAGP
jgi:ribosomal protein S18 acetylase RimI-like enzyme